MAAQRHANEGIQQDGIGKAVKRRGILAAAGAVVAGIATGTIVGSAPPAGQAGSDDPSRSSSTLTPNFAAPAADTLYYTVDGNSFVPSISSQTYAYAGNGAIYPMSVTGVFSAFLDLPQGATLRELVFSLIHNNAGGTVLQMWVYDANNNGYNTGIATVSAMSASIVTINVALPPTAVDNSRYVYVARWAPANADSTDVLFGARMGYTLPSSAQVYGNAQAGIGVFGQSASGTGIKGLIPGGSAAGTVAISGTNNSSAANSHGIIGTAGSGHGLIGNTNFTGGGPPYYGGLIGNAPNGAYAGLFFGNVSINGTLNGHTAIMVHSQMAVAHPDGSHRLSYALSATENWIEDGGKGTLANGQANVKIDPAFAAIADTNDYDVFLTAYGNYNLHVAEMKADGFMVRVTDGGTSIPPTAGVPVGVSQVAKASNVAGTFSWKVVAKRKDGQAARLAAYTFPNIQAPHIPDAPTKP